MKNKRVLVAMSGGIDSSVAAILLQEQGYDIIGVTMKTWDYETSSSQKKQTGCCSLDDINDARALAVKLGFQHFVIDIRDEFGSFVVNNFVDEYLSRRTPNPCVLCNTYIKWEALIKRADQLNCDFIATGHYANIHQDKETGRWYVSKGEDKNKDQSYVLWGVSQKNLSKTLLPLGKYTKPEIRTMAEQRGFKQIAQKPESFEICFVPDNDYRQFLKHKVKDLDNKIGMGDFIDNNDNILGQHKGYPFYTIGQRKGLEIALGEPMYVIEILPKTNQVRLGRAEDLKKTLVTIKQINYQKTERLNKETDYLVKIRYKDKGSVCRLKNIDKDALELELFSGAKGVAPGQSAVIYKGEELIAGGIIHGAI